MKQLLQLQEDIVTISFFFLVIIVLKDEGVCVCHI